MCGKKQFWNDLKSGRFVEMVRDSAKGEHLTSPEDVYNIMRPVMAEHSDVEAIYGIFLNTKNLVQAIEKLFSGSIASSSIYPREVIKRVLNLKSNALILVHNHPSGCIEPSRADYEISLRLGIALESISVAFLDHIIIGEGYFSMTDSGWMERMQRKITERMSDAL